MENNFQVNLLILVFETLPVTNHVFQTTLIKVWLVSSFPGNVSPVSAFMSFYLHLLGATDPCVTPHWKACALQNVFNLDLFGFIAFQWHCGKACFYFFQCFLVSVGAMTSHMNVVTIFILHFTFSFMFNNIYFLPCSWIG